MIPLAEIKDFGLGFALGAEVNIGGEDMFCPIGCAGTHEKKREEGDESLHVGCRANKVRVTLAIQCLS